MAVPIKLFRDIASYFYLSKAKRVNAGHAGSLPCGIGD
jgi:hypothetical protein